MQKIRIVSPSMGGGGSERVCLLLANYWVGQGVDVELALVRREGVLLPKIHPSVRLVSPESRRVRHAILWFATRWTSDKSTPILIFGYDVAIVFGILRRSGVMSAPLIFREGSLPELNVTRFRQLGYRNWIAYLDGVIAQTKYAASSIQRLSRGKLYMAQISNPLIHGTAAGFRHCPNGGLKLLSVGRLAMEKGFDRLLQSVADSKVRALVEEVVIAGDGSERSVLEDQVGRLSLGSIVKMPGFVDSVDKLYAQADIFVLPSIFEGMPNALIEALGAGCRVLASGGGGVRELLEEIGLEDCYVEDSDWAGDFDRKLRLVCTLPAERWSIARSRLAEKTNLARVANQYLVFCKTVGLQDERVI